MTPHDTREALLALGLITLSGFASLPCWAIVIFKMFKNDKPLVAVLGILCWPWAFIWGWMKSGTLSIKKVMIPWTLCIVLGVIGGVVFAPNARELIELWDSTEPDRDVSTPAPERM
jgi:hypothetical protein